MIKHLLALLLTSLLVISCSSMNQAVENVLPDKSVDYKKEKQADKSLEVPPDLTSSSINNSMAVPEIGGVSTSYSEYLSTRELGSGIATAYRGDVLPEVKDINVKRDGDSRWLVIGAPPESVWPKLVDFWQDNGILLAEQDPTVGVMRTTWLENRGDISSDWLTDSLRGFFDGIYDAGTRDQYRLRLERGTREGTTELYLTHFGMQEQLMTSSAGETDQSVWNPRGRDKDLEAEMLGRIMVYLGVSREKAKDQLLAKAKRGESRSEMVKGRSGVSLIIEEDYARSWRLVGLSLDRVGFAVEDRNRSEGVYYVRYHDPSADMETNEGWLSKLNFWSNDKDVDKVNRYQVKVTDHVKGSQVIVLNEQGQRVNNTTAERILTLIHEQVR